MIINREFRWGKFKKYSSSLQYLIVHRFLHRDTTREKKKKVKDIYTSLILSYLFNCLLFDSMPTLNAKPNIAALKQSVSHFGPNKTISK